jgi:hypothetical protein
MDHAATTDRRTLIDSAEDLGCNGVSQYPDPITRVTRAQGPIGDAFISGRTRGGGCARTAEDAAFAVRTRLHWRAEYAVPGGWQPFNVCGPLLRPLPADSYPAVTSSGDGPVAVIDVSGRLTVTLTVAGPGDGDDLWESP